MNIENREVSQELINSIDNLRKSISQISVYDFNIYSSMELYYTLANKINELIKLFEQNGIAISDEFKKQNECLQYLLNDGLKIEVVNKLNAMVNDGTLESLINLNIFNKKIDIVGNYDNSIPSKFELYNNYRASLNTNKLNNIFTIGTYNVRGFRNLSRSIIKRALYNIYRANCNVCCIQEVLQTPFFMFDNVLQTSDFNNFYFRKAIDKDNGEYGIGMMSNQFLVSPNSIEYSVTGAEKRVCQKVELNFNNKIISIYNTHLSVENEGIIQSQITELKNFISQDNNQYKIVCGDFNTDNLSLLQPILDLGFSMANDGSQLTYKTQGKAIDNILYTNNMTLRSVDMIVTDNDEVSDHNLLFANLEVL